MGSLPLQQVRVYPAGKESVRGFWPKPQWPRYPSKTIYETSCKLFRPFRGLFSCSSFHLGKARPPRAITAQQAYRKEDEIRWGSFDSSLRSSLRMTNRWVSGDT